MTAEPEEILVSRIFRVVRYRALGRDGRQHLKDVVVHPGAVTILPLVDDQHVCLIKNCRVAVGKTLVELPAGTLEPGEDPDVTAHRELIEETGYRADRIEKLREFYLSPGILSERMHLYVARGLQAGATALEPGEQIETLVVSWSDAMHMAFDGTIEDAKTLIGLWHWDHVRREQGAR